MLKRVLIANRGEIAVRIIRACHELGVEAVAVYSTADAPSLHVKLADHAVCIGPPDVKRSYLNIQQILSAAVSMHCDGIHPGFGFLSENAEFAYLCEQIGIKFIGPNAETIKKLGHKTTAKQMMREQQVPVVPGSESVFTDAAEALESAYATGFPVIIKAASGGGGRGIRVIHSPSEFASNFYSASQEAQIAFGDPGMYIEKFLSHPRHIEFQMIADEAGDCICLGERDCSSQRRKQKIIEESPCCILNPSQRIEMGQLLEKAMTAIGYWNAGTVEFLYDHHQFFFMEVNTRIQVEHPVTEMRYGFDLVQEQIRIASGLPLSIQKPIEPRVPWVIEARINAENPSKNFMPSAGAIHSLRIPGGYGVRVETALHTGAEIPPFYDSMVAKVIAEGNTRDQAISRLLRALHELEVEGVETNTLFVENILRSERFRSGDFDIHWVENELLNPREALV